MIDANNTIDKIRSYHPELTAIRRDIHTHPEIGMTEVRTAELVANSTFLELETRMPQLQLQDLKIDPISTHSAFVNFQVTYTAWEN